jgi:hypothetical protein
MARRDLSAFFDDGLDYTGIPSRAHPDGKTYRVPCVDAKTGLWLTALTDIGVKAVVGGEITDEDAASLKLDDDQEKRLYERVLGPVWHELLDDGVSYDLVQRIARDAYLTFALGQEAADEALATAMEVAAAGELPAPQDGAPETEQPAKPKTPRTQRKTGGSSSKTASTDTPARTRTRASTPSSTSPSGSSSSSGEAAVAG